MLEDKKTRDIVKFSIITFLFVVSSISLINTSGDLNERIEWHYNYINDNNNVENYDLETNKYSEKLNLVNYNYYLQKFIYSLVVFSVLFVLFITNLEKRFSIVEEIKKWQQNKK